MSWLIYIISTNPISPHQELSTSSVILPTGKKQNNPVVPTTREDFRHNKRGRAILWENRVCNPMRRPPLHHPQAGRQHSWLTSCALQSQVEGYQESIVGPGAERAEVRAGQDPDKAGWEHREPCIFLCLNQLLFPLVTKMHPNSLFRASWIVEKRQIRTFSIMLLSILPTKSVLKSHSFPGGVSKRNPNIGILSESNMPTRLTHQLLLKWTLRANFHSRNWGGSLTHLG